MSPDEWRARVYANFVRMRALAGALLDELDKMELDLQKPLPQPPVDATDDRLNAEIRRRIAETYPPADPKLLAGVPGGYSMTEFSTEIAEPTPEQLARVRRLQKEKQEPKPTPELTPTQKANLKLVKDYIRANSDGGEHVE